MTEENRQAGIMGTVGELVKFGYSYSTLEMFAKGTKTGYSVPWSRGIGKGAIGIGKKFGYNLGVSYGSEGTSYGLSRGLRFAEPAIARGAPIYRNALGGYKQFTGNYLKATPAILRNVAMKKMIGRVAGLGIGYLNLRFAMLPFELAWNAYKGIAETGYARRNVETGGYFPETRDSLTSRQRTVRAISESRLQARSAIGNEASLLHR